MVNSSWTALLMAGACFAASVAHAQNAPSQSSASTSSGTAQVGEVVVTAQRRAERLHDVPIAVSAISANKLATSNFTGLTDITSLVPSLQYNDYLGGGFQIRGVGTQSLNISTEQDVAVVIDDVVQGLPNLTFAFPTYQALTDIDQIAVLRGPQGTLFGKNSSVGVIQIVTKRPELNVFSADASATAATHGEYNFTANINIPIGDTIAARISAFEYHHDGFIKNEYNDQWLDGYDQYGIRAKLLWTPNSTLSVYLIADYIKTDSPGNGSFTLRSCGSGFIRFSPCATDAPYGVVASPTNRTVALDAPTPALSETKSGSLHIDYKIGRDTLSFITAYIDLDTYENVDVDESTRPIYDLNRSVVDGHEFTQEIRLLSPSNQFFEYTMGAYYYNTTSHFQSTKGGTLDLLPDSSPILLTSGLAGTVSGGQTLLDSQTQSYALYGQGALHITPKFQLIGGLRYTHDDVGAQVQVVPYPNLCVVGYASGGPCQTVMLPSTPETEATSANNVSGKVTLKYDFTGSINAYATVSTGYKGPAISYTSLTPLSAAEPETSQAYEIGLKSEFLDRRLTLNADIFYEKYKNFQADTFHLNAADPSASNFELANAGGLESKGVEVDATWLAARGLTLEGNFAYNPTRFTDFVIQCQNNYTNPATVGSCYKIGTTELFNARGYPLPQAPKWSYTLSANYQHSITDNYVFDGNVNWAWKSSTYSIVANPNTIQGGYGLLNASLGIGPRDHSWRVSIFGQNLLNQQFVAAIFPSFLDGGPAVGVAVPTVGYSNVPTLQSLRTVGIKLDVRFGG
jgi:iron complex outermembrane receptor protein